MANTAENLTITSLGPEGISFHLPVDGGAHIYEGSFVSQLTATGCVVPTSTAASGVCVGVATMESDNTSGSDGDKRVKVETKRLYLASNGTAGDAFSDASLIGSVAYAFDDHTVYDNSASNTLQPVGFFMGMDASGKVKVFVDPVAASIVAAIKAIALTDSPASADALRDDLQADLAGFMG